MGFGLTKEHHGFYHTNHFIEFEDLLSSKEVDQLEKSIEPLISTEEWIHSGHDVWRQDDQIKKITLRKNLAELASHLSKKRPLRIAYDQVLKGPLSNESHNLIELSSIRKVVCGLILQLDPVSVAEESLVPKKKGSGVFFSPFCALDIPKGSHLFMIVYAEDTPLYLRETRDPNIHALKKLRYGFGDKILSSTHPLIIKSPFES